MVGRQEREATPSSPEKLNGDFKGKDILSIDQFDRDSLQRIFEATDRIRRFSRSQNFKLLPHSIIAVYFNESSTRTSGSFLAGTHRLGGKPLDARQNPVDIDSVEFEQDILSLMAQSDLIAIRHPQTGSVRKAWEISISQRNEKHVPIINAGDGGDGEHPTQALLDLYTLKQKKGRLDNLTGVIARDLRYGRTVKSLLRGLALYPGNTMYLLSPPELRLPREDLSDFSKRGLKLIEISNEEEMPKNADFWYWTRIQEERFQDKDLYEKVRNCFIADQEFLDRYADKDTILMHPGPRNNEIPLGLKDPRFIMFEQARNGMPVRMALLNLVLGKI